MTNDGLERSQRLSFGEYASQNETLNYIEQHSESSYDLMAISPIKTPTTPTTLEAKSYRRSSFAQYEMKDLYLCDNDFSDSTWEEFETDDDLSMESVSSIDWDTTCGELDSVYSSYDFRFNKPKRTKKVRFDCVKVREFALTVGETQTMDEHDCPLELSWTYSPFENILPLLSPGMNRNTTPRRLSLRQRQVRLVESQRAAASWYRCRPQQ